MLDTSQRSDPNLKAFLDGVKRSGLLPTYGSIRLHSAYTDFAPEEVDLSSLFSLNVGLKVPFVSAAMDTVTEARMAIAMARLGGLGVIHRKMLPAAQAKMVARVKHAMNGFIPDPVSIPPEWTVNQFVAWREAKGYTFGRFFIQEGADPKGHLHGFITDKKLQFCRDRSVQVSEIMIPASKLTMEKEGITKEQALRIMYDGQIESLPIIKKDGGYGLFLFNDLKRILEEKNSMVNVDHLDRLRVAGAIGTGPAEIARAEELLRENVDVLVLDVAHINSKYGRETILEVLSLAKGRAEVVGGNVSHPISALALAKLGVHGIKIGQGSGSICTTGVKTGVGAPQGWAVAACSLALIESGFGHIPVCADGGIAYSGNITVAIGLRARSVMIGSLLAGTEETPGIPFYDPEGRQFKKYRGMASKAALMEDANRYGLEGVDKDERISEGVESEIPFKGPLYEVFKELKGGLRQGMYDAGCRTIEELRQRTEPYVGAPDAVREAHPHDVKVVSSA